MSGARRPAFTLIELMVVAGIITLLLAMTLPALSAMWAQRKQAHVQNTLRGVLSSARVQAKSRGERGLFFCLIDGVQKVFPIVREPLRPFDPLDPTTDPFEMTDNDTLDRFLVVEGDVHTFPDPLRVVPRYVVDNTGSSWDRWDADELTNEFYRSAPGNATQVHRNFFTMIFSADGRLMPSRNVLIHDPDLLPTAATDGFGDRTGFPVSAITQYADSGGTVIVLPGPALPDIVDDTGNDGLNFIGVDGILVYDDSLFRDLAPVDGDGLLRQELIIRTGRPMYVSRVTGEIIMGPVAENEAP
ncbi:MAG: prepilin-type N-terminal cleavage/methylation domain-containing protein [Planctomycetes bacterium]|nr:prepilin-type N-terminal cleavage/methylation domain-containing protein [Planctomycetota bacterium]